MNRTWAEGEGDKMREMGMFMESLGSSNRLLFFPTQEMFIDVVD